MKAAYLFGPRDVRIVEREPLALRADDVRVEVAYSGICGTELHLYGGMIFGTPMTEPAAALTEPLACAIRAVDRSEMRTGDRVCVIGAGPIGLFVVAMAKAAGASTLIVSEPRAARRALAERLGADIVVDPTDGSLDGVVRDATHGMGADVVFEAVGHPSTVEQAIGVAAPGGT